MICECEGYCSKCRGIMTVVVGVLMLVNVWWIGWTGQGWFTFFAWLFVVLGIIRAFKPNCGCGSHMPAGKKK